MSHRLRVRGGAEQGGQPGTAGAGADLPHATGKRAARGVHDRQVPLRRG